MSLLSEVSFLHIRALCEKDCDGGLLSSVRITSGVTGGRTLTLCSCRGNLVSDVLQRLVGTSRVAVSRSACLAFDVRQTLDLPHCLLRE